MMRPANIVTSVADVLAGIAISGYFTNLTFSANSLYPVALLCLSTMGLYGGGIVFNDVFDAELDKVERPERAIPQGIVTVKQATILGAFLLLWGIGFGYAHSPQSGLIAVIISFLALLYNKVSKNFKFAGPLNMGLCRGFNLILGMSIITTAITQWYAVALLPIVYIFSITMISQGEVHGSDKRNLYIGGFLYMMVASGINVLSQHFSNGKVIMTYFFVVPFLVMILKPLGKAINQPTGPNIGKAVKAGVISLILMDAAIAAAFGAILPALIIACLLPISLRFAKIFAVT